MFFKAFDTVKINRDRALQIEEKDMKIYMMLCVLLFSVLTIVFHPAYATVITFDSRTAWETALNGAVQTENFDRLPEGTLIPRLTHNLGLIDFTYDGELFMLGSGEAPAIQSFEMNRFFVGTPFRTENGAGITRPGPHVFSTQTPIFAFGADFRGIDAADLIIDVARESFSLMKILTGPNGFFGIISDTSFNIITMSAGSLNVQNEAFTMDDFSVSSVPLPGSIVLLGSALASLFIVRTYKKQFWF